MRSDIKVTIGGMDKPGSQPLLAVIEQATEAALQRCVFAIDKDAPAPHPVD